jgi:(p)ppGpp synthase/HD superfamily hydrolase
VDQTEPTVEDAIALAARLHSGARYPSPEAEPFVFHALRVMLHFVDPVDQTAAVLHDVVEDTEITLDNLRDAGYRPEVVDAIGALTHHPQDSYEQYIEGVARNPVARRVKIVDLEQNLANNLRSPLTRGNADRVDRYKAALTRLRDT